MIRNNGLPINNFFEDPFNFTRTFLTFPDLPVMRIKNGCIQNFTTYLFSRLVPVSFIPSVGSTVLWAGAGGKKQQ